MVRQVRALSISEDARLWLSQARRPRVLNSFERAWTLVDDRKRVLSIVTPAIGNGPVSIVVPDARLPALPETATIHCTLDRLETPTLIIDTASTAQWDATLPLNIPKVADMIYCGRHVLRHSADSLAQPYLNLPPPAAAFERIMMRRLTHATQALIRALVHNDALTTAVSALAGQGFGLTPSGDDWLLGVIVALHCLGNKGRAARIAQIALPHTTAFSAELLRMAGQRKLAQPWHRLAQAETAQQMEDAMRAIVQIGHSSGADALTGFVQMLEACQDSLAASSG